MSREKVNISKLNFKIIGNRVTLIRYGRGLSQDEFGKYIGISKGNVSCFENHKYEPSFKVLVKIIEQFNVNPGWLLTGGGTPYQNEMEDASIYKDALDEDPEVAKFLEKTREIIKSGTEYAFSLKANIGSFHNAMLLERKVQDHETRLALVEKVKSGGCAAGVSDPPAEKNDPGKCGAM